MTYRGSNTPLSAQDEATFSIHGRSHLLRWTGGRNPSALQVLATSDAKPRRLNRSGIPTGRAPSRGIQTDSLPAIRVGSLPLGLRPGRHRFSGASYALWLQ